MGDFYSGLTHSHYPTKEMKEDFDKKYMADLEKKKIKQLEDLKNQNSVAIEEARKNAEKVAIATKEAERERYYNELELEKIRSENEKELEDIRFEHANKLRLQKLCDNYGLDYDDLKTFELWLHQSSIKAINERINYIKKELDILSTEEINEVYMQYLEVKEKINKLHGKVKKKISVKGLVNNNSKEKGTKEELYKLVSDNAKSKIYTIVNIRIFIFSIVGVISLLVGNYTFLFITLLVAIFDLCIQINNVKVDERYKKNSIDEHEQKRKDILNSFNSLKEKQQNYISKLSQLLFEQSLVKEDNILEEDIGGEVLFNNMKEFNDFRKNHYNDDIEILLRRLKLSIPLISEDEIEKSGTINEYVNFIDNSVNIYSVEDNDKKIKKAMNTFRILYDKREFFEELIENERNKKK